MTLPDLVRLLRRTWLLVVAVAVSGGAVGTLIALVATPVYRSDAELFISVQPGSPDVSDLAQGNSAAQQKVRSYAEVVRSASVLHPVIAELHLHETVAQLAQRVTATAKVDSVLLEIAVRDTDPHRSREIAAATAESFRTVVTDHLEKPTAGGPSLVRVETIQPPVTPSEPESPSLPKDLALGLGFGVAAGVGLALLGQTLDTRIRTQSDVESVTDVPVLGSIGQDPTAEAQPLIVQVDPLNPRAESFRTLRTNVQFVHLDERRRSFTITSALPTQGKTTTAANLAIAMAENGAKVVLVDADLRRPRLAEVMGIDGTAGLTDVLIGQAELEDVLMPWGRGGLHVLPAGRIPPNPSELLGGTAMRTLVDLLTAEHDAVVFDAPPLLPVTDAAVLSRLTGGAMLITAVGRTTRGQLRAALDALRSVGTRTVGIVMTMVPTDRRGTYGTYYAYYHAGDRVDPDVAPRPRGGRRAAHPGRLPQPPRDQDHDHDHDHDQEDR